MGGRRGASLSSMPTVKRDIGGDSKQGVKAQRPREDGISVVVGEAEEDTQMFRDRLARGDAMDIEDQVNYFDTKSDTWLQQNSDPFEHVALQWPPVITSKFQPMALPFSRRRAHQSGAQGLAMEPVAPIFDDEVFSRCISRDRTTCLNGRTVHSRMAILSKRMATSS